MFTFRTWVILLAMVATALAETRSWKQYKEVLQKIETDSKYEKEWAKHIKQFQQMHDADLKQTREAFTCPISPVDGVATSVHQLRPQDIKVMGAMGDSLTAGNGIRAWTPIGCLTEYRGYSWSIGGQGSFDDDEYTLPNIYRQYSPSLTGFSTGTGGRNNRNAKLNVADPGNVASDMPYQAQLLVDRIKEMSEVDYQNDWKLVTLFIGGNDLCDYCYDEESYTVEKYVGYIQEALDILHANLPRTFVNVVSIFDISPLASLSDGLICGAIHWAVCNCPKEEDFQGVITDIAMKYSEATENLINSGRYEGRDDFTAVFQPFMKENDVPRLSNGEPDMSFFAPDCFHFSQKGQTAAAKMIFSAMFEPVGQKRTSSDFYAPLKCPEQGAYFATAKNSMTKSKQAFAAAAPAPQAVDPADSPSNQGASSHLAIILAVTGSALAVVVIIAGVFLYKRKFRKDSQLEVLT